MESFNITLHCMVLYVMVTDKSMHLQEVLWLWLPRGLMETFNSGSSQLMPALDQHHYPPLNQR